MAEKNGKIAKIVVDRNLCIGAASCVVAAGEVFALDEENKAVMRRTGGTNSSDATLTKELAAGAVSDEELLAAAQSCPTRAIFLYDEAGNLIYPA